MTDIAELVERLRHVAKVWENEEAAEAADALETMWGKIVELSEVQHELTAAKAEIAERKKAVNLWADELLKVRQMARVDIEKLEAEIARLRAALEDAEADMRRYADDPTPERRLVSADAIRAALTGRGE